MGRSTRTINVGSVFDAKDANLVSILVEAVYDPVSTSSSGSIPGKFAL